MIWYNISELESKISDNELTDKDGLNYVLAHFILSALTVGINTQNEIVWIPFLNSLIMVAITIWGLNKVYKANNEIDRKDFFKRFFAINWVIGMRLLSILLVFVFCVEIVKVLLLNSGYHVYMENTTIKHLIQTGFMSMFGLMYYLLVINSFRRLKPITE